MSNVLPAPLVPMVIDLVRNIHHVVECVSRDIGVVKAQPAIIRSNVVPCPCTVLRVVRVRSPFSRVITRRGQWISNIPHKPAAQLFNASPDIHATGADSATCVLPAHTHRHPVVSPARRVSLDDTLMRMDRLCVRSVHSVRTHRRVHHRASSAVPDSTATRIFPHAPDVLREPTRQIWEHRCARPVPPDFT